LIGILSAFGAATSWTYACFIWRSQTQKYQSIDINLIKNIIAFLIFIPAFINLSSTTELKNILKLLMEKIGVRDAIEAWKGPDKLVKDFLLSSIGVEVKTKQGGLKGQVQISSEFQLSKDNLSKLFLLVFTVDKSTEINPNSFTLTEQIEDIKNFIIQKDINSLDEFLGKVYMSRYDEKHDYKSDFWLLVDPYQLFIVKEKSPRISPENINCNFLSEVKYKLSLEGLKDSLLENLDAIYDEL